MTLDEMKKLKKQQGYTNERISDGSGVPLGTVRKVFSGETQYDGSETVSADLELTAQFSKIHTVGFMPVASSVRCIRVSTRVMPLTMMPGPMMGISHLRSA